MTTDRRRRRGEDTRARIMSAAAELFAAQGFDATSTQAIAAASGITVAAIYRHVPSKSDLLVAVARHALETTFAETMTDVGTSTAAQRISDIVVAYTEPQREFTRRLVVELTHAAAQHPEVASSLQRFHQRARQHIADVARGGPARRLPQVRCRRHACRARCPAADHGHLQHRRPRPGRPRRPRMASHPPPHRPRHDRVPGLGLSRSNSEARRSADALAAAPPHTLDSQFADGAAHDPARRSLAAGFGRRRMTCGASLARPRPTGTTAAGILERRG